MTPAEKTLILCDFDGTASITDVGNELLDRFTDDGWEEIDRDYCKGLIGSRLAYTRIAPLFKGTRSEMLAHVLSIARLDADFEVLCRLCIRHDIDIKIISDGLDFYIEALLAKQGLAGIEYFANRVIFEGKDAIRFEFPGRSDDCGRCGNCKSAILKRHRPAYSRIIYIGDSYSDVCPAKEADMIFAKTILYEKCLHNGTSCFYFENFKEIVKYLNLFGIIPAS